MKISIGDGTVRLVARVILALTVFAMIGQTYHIILIAATLFTSLQGVLGSPIFYITFAELWFYGFNPQIDPAWPGLIVAIACLAVLAETTPKTKPVLA